MRFHYIILIVGFFIGLTNSAEAKKNNGDEGILIEITVLDAKTQEPIPTAVVKHSKASQPSKVNSVTGTWSDSESIDRSGDIHKFLPGNTEEFSVSASGYMTYVATYDVRRRNNVIRITLEEMEIIAPNLDDTIIPFGRDTIKTDSGPGGAQ
jgi:hypothetical protein